jgi:hypothetical protein
MQPPSTVTFILDSEYGLRAVAHARVGPVWLVDSPHNAEAERLGRAEGLNVTLLTANGQSPEEWLLNHLDSVDQHHNEQAGTVGYSELQVVGVGLTRRIEQYLPEFGFAQWAPTAEGFVAKKVLSRSKAGDA